MIPNLRIVGKSGINVKRIVREITKLNTAEVIIFTRLSQTVEKNSRSLIHNHHNRLVGHYITTEVSLQEVS